jgi:hypothetical protein
MLISTPGCTIVAIAIRMEIFPHKKNQGFHIDSHFNPAPTRNHRIYRPLKINGLYRLSFSQGDYQVAWDTSNKWFMPVNIRCTLLPGERVETFLIIK